jgi:hypothetical protein
LIPPNSLTPRQQEEAGRAWMNELCLRNWQFSFFLEW